jgi:hypothetical protein
VPMSKAVPDAAMGSTARCLPLALSLMGAERLEGDLTTGMAGTDATDGATAVDETAPALLLRLGA